MEGKSGINFVLMIVAVLFVVLGVVLCIMFGINQTIPGRTYNVAINLYVGLAAIGLGALMLIGCNIATNARITADNSYDTMRHVELLCQKEGFSLADLARKEQKTAQKEANLMEKQEKKQQAEAQQQVQAQATLQQSVQTIVQNQPLPQQNAGATGAEAERIMLTTEVQAEAEAAAATTATASEADADTAAATAAAPEVLNSGISLEDWKAKMEGINVVCGACGEPMSVRNTRIGKYVLACKKVNDGCPSTPFPLDVMVPQFIEWYNAAFGATMTEFDIDVFAANVGSISVKDGVAKFTGK